eukprot:TRINITY_DN13040_c0_g1_i1.p1 TRINITY_DN13040_c0_g1~~TRINITY_DN13040_c0_g1_i1.p1  ORF type:complete len:112 (-),score=23.90 TRINITY_DN13040_c0_g1_i1:226-561(-)
MSATRFFQARGKVQNVMFRQTLMRGAQKRGITAGATNTPSDASLVTFTLSGDKDKVNEVVEFIRAGNELNEWGAKVSDLKEEDDGTPVLQHEVNTSNVDSIQWTTGVAMYL